MKERKTSSEERKVREEDTDLLDLLRANSKNRPKVAIIIGNAIILS